MRKVWEVLYPLLYYYAVMLITMTIAQWIFGDGNEQYVLCRLISTVVTIPFIVPFFTAEQALSGRAVTGLKFLRESEEASEKKATIVKYALSSIIIAACLSVALNNIISMTPLVELSSGFKEANEAFYGSTFALELVSSALFTPILEELVFRGIIFTRLRRELPKYTAIALSALIFAMVHWNLVQFIYALILGFVLALLMERADHLYAAVLGHITANLIAVVRTETGFLSSTVQGDAFSWAVSVALLLIGALGVWIFCFRKNK
jgi:hypothetical protein